jgi:hypothetical protein
MRAILSFPGAACDRYPQFWPVPSLRSDRLHRPTAAFSSSPTKLDGYGVDQCLAKGEKCGAHAARSYCQSRDFALATSYRRVDPDEITGSVPKAGSDCHHAGCNEYVAITCQR